MSAPADRDRQPILGLQPENLRALAELACDWVWEQDADFRFTAVSGEYHGRAGRRTDTSLGACRWELPLVGVSEPAWQAHRAQLDRHEVFRDFVFGRRDEHGELRWYSVSGMPLFDEHGGFVGYRGVGHEITAQRRAELALRDSEQRLRAMLELSSDWYWVQDEQHRLVAREGGVLGRMGLPPDADLGKAHWEIGYINMSEADWAAHRAQLDRREEFRDLLLARRNAAGQVRWGRLSGRPRYDRDGRFLGYHGIGRGATAEIEAVEALRRSEAQLRLVTDNVPAAIGYLDRELRLRYANRGFEVVFGADPAPLMGLHISAGIGADTFEQVRAHFTRVLAGEAVAYRRRVRVAGEDRTLQVSLVPHRGAEGTIEGCYSVTMDVTRLEHAERVAQVNRELEAFAHTVSHDLRNPVRRIATYVDLVLAAGEGVPDADARSNLERVREITARMAELIDDLLAFSRVDAAPVARERFDLSALARAVADDLSAHAPGRRVDWRIRPGVEALGDADLMRIVLENLLGNAWKYTRERADAVIEFDAAPAAGAMLEFLVRDNGAGFDMAYADKLFQPFERLHPATRFEGSGVGLATVARIVQRHGGSVHAEGIEGRGATFRVRLPAALGRAGRGTGRAARDDSRGLA